MIKEKILKHDNILMILIILIITSTTVGMGRLLIGDELWNFSTIYKMYNGYIIYKDLNVLVTPLYFFIGNLIFHLLGANYLSYRIYERIIINSFLFFSIYILFKKIKIKKENAMEFTIFIAILWMAYMQISTYNINAIIFVIIGIIIEISDYKKTYKKNIIQGIVIFLILITKQNIGIYYILGILTYNFIKLGNLKTKIKSIITTLSTTSIILIIFIIYLQQKGILNDFISLTFGGVKEFANKNILSEYLWLFLVIFEVFIEIIFIKTTYSKKICLTDKEKNDIRFILITALFMSLIAFPIANEAHALYVTIIFIISFIYFINKIYIADILNKNNKIQKINRIIMCTIIFCELIINLSLNVSYYKNIHKNTYYFNKDNPYYGVIAKDETIKEIADVCSYIKEQNDNGVDVKIISCYSNLYMNILKRNNGKMDLPFNGNLGKEGEDGLIINISELKNTKILILNDNENNYGYQESKKVIAYIKENLEYTGDFGRFSIYYKK